MTVQQILDYVNELAPAELKYDWDNVGLLCGSRSQEVKRVLVALDPFESVCREAIACGAELIVTHHPLIFQPPRTVTEDTTVGRSILLLASHNISAINAHTNLDRAPGGVNDVLAQTLGLEAVEVLNPCGVDAQGRPWGLLRAGIVEEQPLAEFLSHVKRQLHTPVLRYADGGRPVHRVAVGGGACGDGLMEALAAGCDTFVTADLKYNQFWDAHDLGLNLIDAGHFYTENPVCAVLANALQAKFPNLEILRSSHRDCMAFF